VMSGITLFISRLVRSTTIPLLKHALSRTPLAVLTQVVCVIPIQADDSSSIKNIIQFNMALNIFRLKFYNYFHPTLMGLEYTIKRPFKSGET